MQILEGGKVKKIWRQNAAEWGDRITSGIMDDVETDW